MASFSEILHGSPMDESEIARVRDILLFEEPGLQQRLVRFGCLLVLAASIATFGLISDSVAAVIGAMIVAPLMLPIMGLAFGISIGDRKAILSSLVVALCGIVAAICVGFVLSLPWSGLNPEVNAQIMARTTPRLVDLAAALATGLAGAFAMGRRDVSDTLPGVAIAISLVPPLANVGILMAAGRPDLAGGSLLLFATNYLAIVLTGAFMFGLMGFPRFALENRSTAARRTAIALVAVLSVVIALPLAAQTYKVATSNAAEKRTTDAAESWLSGTGYRVVSVKVDGDVHMVVTGQGPLPSTASLQQQLKDQLFGKHVTIEALPHTLTGFDTR